MLRLVLAILLGMSVAIGAHAKPAGPDDIKRYDWLAGNGSLMRYESVMGWVPTPRAMDPTEVEDFSGWKPTTVLIPKNQEVIFTTRALISCLKNVKKLGQ